MTLTYEQLVFLKNTNEELDEIVEGFQTASSSLSVALEGVYKFLKSKIQISGLFIFAMDENLVLNLFSYGTPFLAHDELTSFLSQQVETKSYSFNEETVYLQLLDMAGQKLGQIAISFDKESNGSDEFKFELLHLISELLDSYLYSIYMSGIKQNLLVELQYIFKKPYSETLIDEAVVLIEPYTNFSKLLFIYSEIGLTNKEIIKYIYFIDGNRVSDSTKNPSSNFDRFIYSKNHYLSVSYDEASELLDVNDVDMAYLKDGKDGNIFGLIITDTNPNANMSVFVKDLWQIFVRELRQYVLDLNREKNILSKHFSNLTIDRLLKNPNYVNEYLTPREVNIAILFADISGFTKISEQILVEPEAITSFVNKWANGAVSRVAPLGGCLDKLIGDCLMFLFGPPFYDESEDVVVNHALQSAKQIVKFTESFLALKENQEIQKHRDYKKFGVSIGINYCSAIVGLTGPNADLTAFSSGVNSASRLQEFANPNQILVLNSVYEIASKYDRWKFTGPQSIKVKNVIEPLLFYNLK